jgi:hypothetical protein
MNMEIKKSKRPVLCQPWLPLCSLLRFRWVPEMTLALKPKR